MKITYLSHFINEQTPLYGGENAIKIEDRSKIIEGASSNTKFLQLPNHAGTHIDFPKHFSNSGKTINDYHASSWKFTKVFVIKYIAKKNEIIDETVIDLNNIPFDTEFLCIYTGFSNKRTDKAYWNNNPGIAPSFAKAIKTKCPNLRVIGFDFISLSSYQNRIIGRDAHKEFLLKYNILIIEDMKLDKIHNKTINTIIALPFLIDNIDGAPITVIAEYE